MTEVLLTIVFLLALAACDPASETPTATTPIGTPTAGQPAPTSTPTIELPTPTPTPTCELPPPVDLPTPADATLDALAGDTVTLNAVDTLWFASGTEMVWSRPVLAAADLTYSSALPATLTRVSPSSAEVNLPSAGVFRFQAEIGDKTYLVDVRVTKEPANNLAVRAVFMTDLFERLGGPAFMLRRDDPACQAMVFNQAFAAVRDTGANWVGLHPAVFLTQMDPLPKYVPHNNDLSLTDDAYYAQMVAAAKANGLGVIHAEQDGPYFDLPEGQWELRHQFAADPVWMEAWLDELRAWVLPRAARAEAAGVGMYVLFNPANFTFQEGNGYDRLWRELIAQVREVYSGDVGVTLELGADGRFTFADAVDFAIFGADATYFPGHFDDPNNPPFDEMVAVIEEHISRSKPFVEGKTKAYHSFGATSSNGREGSEAQSERATFLTDFQEQALYYEAVFLALEAHPWIEGASFGTLDWFAQYRRSPENWYYDSTNQGSTRSKPTKEALRLWFGMY
ncbi:MAG: hypothetical protein O2812_05130 [Chloroflexi bacterium]|nr:hypothetical protein [Chloroflexota bacterium]